MPRGQSLKCCGQAASALHAMAILQVHQAKALKQMHEGSSDWAVQRHVEGFAQQFSVVEADRGDPAHPAPARCTVSHRCPWDQASCGPPELLCPALNRHLGWRVEPLVGVRRPLMWATQRCWSLLFLRRQRGPRRSFPQKRAGWRILCFILFLFRRWPMGPRSRHNSE